MSYLIILNFLFWASMFYSIYVLFFIFSKKRFEIIRNNLYIIIPLYCILCWAFYFAIFVNPFLEAVSYDFTNFYYCGERVLFKPRDLYTHDVDHGVKYGYKYFPNFAVIIGVPMYLIPSINLAYKIFYIINIILGMIFLLLFNQILILLKLKHKILRFFFLFIISNGFIIFQQFWHNQMKFLIGIIILFILKQEILFRIKRFDKDFKFYLKTYNLFILVVGMFPYFLFFFLVYIFNDISKADLFKKINLKKYFIIIISFVSQNFIFLLYPTLFNAYYKRIRRESTRKDTQLQHFYLEFIEDYLIEIPDIIKIFTSFTLNIILYVIVILLIFIRKFRIEEKFGFLSISIILLNFSGYRILIILLPLTSLLFIPFLMQEENINEFIKRNKIIVIGMISIFSIYLIPTKIQKSYPFFPGITIGLFISVMLLGTSIICLYIKNIKNTLSKKKEKLNNITFSKENRLNSEKSFF